MAGFFYAMVDLKNLWIGDKLRIISSDRLGTFAGLNGNRARIQVGSKIILVTAGNLEPYVASEKPASFFTEEVKTSTPMDFHNFPDTLDLHIDKLAPHLKNEFPARILSYQLAALQDYLDKAELKSARIMTIIHGKGNGTLRREVKHILKGMKSVKLVFDTHDDGAVEVHMY